MAKASINQALKFIPKKRSKQGAVFSVGDAGVFKRDDGRYTFISIKSTEQARETNRLWMAFRRKAYSSLKGVRVAPRSHLKPVYNKIISERDVKRACEYTRKEIKPSVDWE